MKTSLTLFVRARGLCTMICILWDVCFVIVFVNVTVFSSAVLVYLNYKNAYEHWNEQRLALNKEVRIIYLLIFLCQVAFTMCMVVRNRHRLPNRKSYNAPMGFLSHRVFFLTYVWVFFYFCQSFQGHTSLSAVAYTVSPP